MEKLTPKQKAFADNYIVSGNATDAAKKAGYSAKTAYRTGADNLKNAHIIAYIKERTRPAEERRIAEGNEVLEFLSAVMRGEIKDQFGLEASLADRQRAAVELAKRTVDIDAKRNSGSDIAANIKTLADIVLSSKPNRDLSDYE